MALLSVLIDIDIHLCWPCFSLPFFLLSLFPIFFLSFICTHKHSYHLQQLQTLSNPHLASCTYERRYRRVEETSTVSTMYVPIQTRYESRSIDRSRQRHRYAILASIAVPTISTSTAAVVAVAAAAAARKHSSKIKRLESE